MSQSTVVYSTSLHSLGDTVLLDISLSATPCRIRLLDCGQFLDHDVLAIHEYPDIPSFPYTAISYIWKGLGVGPSHTDDKYGTFAIKGAEDGDPISIDVLKHACTAAIQNGSGYIWLDRLCILQNDSDDKAWQIRQMYKIYKSCAMCIVLPGGGRRLARIDEETTWIQRSWTLPEVIAQSNVMILYAWTYGKALSSSSASAVFTYTEVIQGQSAICSLDHALQVSVGNLYELTTERKNFNSFSIKLVGCAGDPNTGALLAALNGGGIQSEAGVQAVWRCSLMRTSSFPVDAVLSIMGLFGVTLDPRAFQKGDRRGATIALAKEILQKGGRASWLAPSLSLPPAKGLSAFPEFPHVSVAGQATLTTEEGDRPVAELLPWVGEGWLDGIPTGMMDDAGYFTFSSSAALLIPTGLQKDDPTLYDNESPLDATGQLQIIAMDGAIWRLHLDGEETYQPERRAFMVFVGALVHYTSAAFGCYVDTYRYRAMLVEEHEAGKFHRTSYFALGEAYMSYIERCKSYTFCLGGPFDE
ncbi:uncharacterized protein EDB91DRAFT_1201330 [Suillus paluster]|uniref:uncharacterized protein n=1 Tax=Suillus paluster TaxID=48578 RepID=UPI001B86CA2F|nr:uncharacterized protein EDB91DRAFT_1201330 [Suillus paluster]KAG1742324.1 hypothetical protein EDB91DRAFT_1201330 [Suillus paluster]